MKLMLAAMLMVLGCTTPTDRVTKSKSFPKAFEDGLNAHGGLEKWRSYGTIMFSEVSDTDTTNYTVDLKNRNELIDKPGHYKVGFTKDEMYISPTPDSFPNKNPRFFHNLRFYFFALPFVTADPGAFQTALEPGELKGRMYDRVKITFGEGVGIAPKDQYILWYDQSSHLLSLINYSVTYFDEENAEKYSAIMYKNWKEVDGLKLPTEMIGYKWESDSLGEERYRRKFSDISLLLEQPDPNLFAE